MGRFIQKFRELRRARKNIKNAALSINDRSGPLFREVLPGAIETEEAWHEKFVLAWTIISPTLSLLKIITKDQVDEVIDNIIAVGNRVANKSASADDEEWFIKFMGEHWGKVRMALMFAMAFTNAKVDEVLAQIIDWGDIVFE